jgi:Terpene synthase family 2, C-terminal metal binding
MVLVRASLGLPCNLDYDTDRTSDDRIHQVQTLVQSVLGLQNDLLGWEKDHKTNNPLNAVEVLIRGGMEASDAYSEVIQSHNHLMRVLLQVARQLMFSSTKVTHSTGFLAHKVYLFAALTNIQIMVGFGSAMAEWMLSSRRYMVQNAQSSEPRLAVDRINGADRSDRRWILV